jgi:peptidylprolyl isomerase
MRLSIGSAAVSLALALALWGCGADDAATSAEKKPSRFGTIVEGEGRDQPDLEPSRLPPPKKVIYRDIKVGSGPPARHGDRVGVNYIGFNYETAEEQYHHWPPLPPLTFRLGFYGDSKVWENSIEGMKAGGRREVIIPSKLLYDTGTIDYIVDLVRVEPVAKGSG